MKSTNLCNTLGAKAPRNFQVRGLSAYSVLLSWEVPERTNRVIQYYRLLYKKASDAGTGHYYKQTC